MAVGGFWLIYFLLRQNWLVAGIDFVFAGAGLCIYLIHKAGHTRISSALLLTTVFWVCLVFSLFMDVPTAAAPRSVHLYFVSVGLCAFYLLHNEPWWTQYGVPSIFFAAFYFFASTHFGIHTDMALPDSVRVAGAWFNAAGAIGVLYVALFLMNTDPTARDTLHTAMRDALAARQFTLHYQPQVDANGHTVGAEALMRWEHPQRGTVSPGQFIPLAEKSGFILALGSWALAEACERLAEWQHIQHLDHLKLSVNVSAFQIRQPDFVDTVKAALQRSGAPAQKLQLELTESMLVKDIDDLIEKMAALTGMGVGFSLDDFGTGYSSLSYLNRLPLRQLKIDQAFVRDVDGDKNAGAIARTLIALGQTLGLTVVAEGVETTEQHTFLLDQGCRVFQGYLFARPLELPAFERFVATGHTRG
jgi:EAL domain-containing protein (putative c-di-GMP-specific phosphodiesterase class I)